MTPLLLALTLAAAPAPSLAGTWTLVSVDNVFADGRHTQPYGPHPAGLLTLDADGRYSVHIFRPDGVRFASGDKSRGTPEEYRAAVQRANTHFGTYSVGDGVIAFRIERALFPNWEGIEQKRVFTLDGDLLRYTVRTTTTTGGTEIGEVTWRRAR